LNKGSIVVRTYKAVNDQFNNIKIEQIILHVIFCIPTLTSVWLYYTNSFLIFENITLTSLDILSNFTLTLFIREITILIKKYYKVFI